MEYFDISKELFSTEVYPGDPAPEKEVFMSIQGGDACNLTILKMGSHNGTHMDAPHHFVDEGRTIDQLSLDQVNGPCSVIAVSGTVDREILKNIMPENCDRLLLKGDFTLTVDGSAYLAEQKLKLYGLEAMTVGYGDDGVAIHRTLLGSDMVILENLMLRDVEEGTYFLCAAPLKMAGLDGAPCRAFLMRSKVKS